MNLRQYTKSDIQGKRVLLRLDLDVEVNDEGKVDELHDLRLERAVPAIKQLLDFGAKQIIMLGHMGRPEGRDKKLSLQPVADHLQTLLDQEKVADKIEFLDDITKTANNRLSMLENLRFWPGEKANDPDFARSLSNYGDVYINDAFGNSHRSDASMLAIVSIAKASFAGLNLCQEIKHLSIFNKAIKHPFLAVMGGAKIETKLPLIKFLLSAADTILLGGGLANTFLRARGNEIGASLFDEAYLNEARALVSDKIIMPQDAVVSNSAGDTRVVQIDAVTPDDFIGDIGPKTIALYQQKLADVAMILFNGSLGKFEDNSFQAGTTSIIQMIISSKAMTLSGGGDTIDVLERLSAVDKFDFVSVGGGAMLTFLAGEPMPVLEALRISNY